ncbi:histidinol-phosphate transaminase [Hyphobacterium sp. HN65]|uniref:Histidinol-phosphate aminotransferase n=1 Tax=Hyphobacterium lacteum TaxID=3116575 RepID=A0ABU7LPZ3_9PROT|nr:histidinol-phosphate transaminase [Hyphobacterium sp. HN65]MEE2525998.1 histidinol-phosphate transaminase [Hyphobacterium sp. HN65]
MTLQPRPGILDIKPYKPGAADAPGIANPVKLSSNENPMGCSPLARSAFEASSKNLNLYPDGGATRLRAAIGKAYNLDPARIVCGTGSDELLQLLGRAYLAPGDKVVQSQYGFLVYRLVAMQSGAELVSAPETNFTTDVDAVLQVAGEDARIVFIANPNNPTGTYISHDEIRRLREGLPENTLLVVDEAYAEYVDRPDYETAFDLAREYDNVVVTRTFSKIHGLAALRLGWAYADGSIIDVLNRVRGPFNVNLPAIEAGIAAIEDTDFQQRSAEHNRQGLAYMHQQLGGLGLDVTPSVGNFVLVHFPETKGKTAAEADAFLTRKGLIVRPVAPYGLPNSLRITIGLDADNHKIVEALTEFMA